MKKIMATLAVAGVAMVGGESADAALIISQYYEGASFDKYIEIYNSGTTAVDLAAGQYKLSHWSNANRQLWKTGGGATATQSLTGTIAPGATFIVEHTQAANPSYVVSNDSDVSEGGVNFNGDDSVVLWAGASYSFANVVDALGVTTTSGFGDTSFVRKSTITTGTNADFNAADWIQFSTAQVASAASNSAEYLGFHVVPEPASLALAGLGGLAILARRRTA